MKSKLLKLAKMLMNFKIISSDNGSLIIDSELAIGAEISIEDENGEVLPAPDGEYIIDNQKITVVEGKITEIEPVEEVVEEPVEKEVVEPETMAEEPATEEPTVEPDEKDAKIAELLQLLSAKDAEITELQAKIQELEEKLNKPVEEPVKMNAVVKEKSGSTNGALRYFE